MPHTIVRLLLYIVIYLLWLLLIVTYWPWIICCSFGLALLWWRYSHWIPTLLLLLLWLLLRICTVVGYYSLTPTYYVARWLLRCCRCVDLLTLYSCSCTLRLLFYICCCTFTVLTLYGLTTSCDCPFGLPCTLPLTYSLTTLVVVTLPHCLPSRLWLLALLPLTVLCYSCPGPTVDSFTLYGFDLLLRCIYCTVAWPCGSVRCDLPLDLVITPRLDWLYGFVATRCYLGCCIVVTLYHCDVPCYLVPLLTLPCPCPWHLTLCLVVIVFDLVDTFALVYSLPTLPLPVGFPVTDCGSAPAFTQRLPCTLGFSLPTLRYMYVIVLWLYCTAPPQPVPCGHSCYSPSAIVIVCCFLVVVGPDLIYLRCRHVVDLWLPLFNDVYRCCCMCCWLLLWLQLVLWLPCLIVIVPWLPDCDALLPCCCCCYIVMMMIVFLWLLFVLDVFMMYRTFVVHTFPTFALDSIVPCWLYVTLVVAVDSLFPTFVDLQPYLERCLPFTAHYVVHTLFATLLPHVVPLQRYPSFRYTPLTFLCWFTITFTQLHTFTFPVPTRFLWFTIPHTVVFGCCSCCCCLVVLVTFTLLPVTFPYIYCIPLWLPYCGPWIVIVYWIRLLCYSITCGYGYYLLCYLFIPLLHATLLRDVVCYL